MRRQIRLWFWKKKWNRYVAWEMRRLWISCLQHMISQERKLCHSWVMVWEGTASVLWTPPRDPPLNDGCLSCPWSLCRQHQAALAVTVQAQVSGVADTALEAEHCWAAVHHCVLEPAEVFWPQVGHRDAPSGGVSFTLRSWPHCNNLFLYHC